MVAIQSAADRITLALRHRAQELAASYRDQLTRKQSQLGQQERALTQEIEDFRRSHPGILPEDPTSVVSQFDKLTSRLEDKQQRLKLVTEQLSRLADYQQKSKDRSAARALTPPPPLPKAPAEDQAVSRKPGDDPEVVALTAQLQLLNDQVDEQLNAKHRTEEHPEVKDLRERQAALQRKLDAARQRASAGQPPPAGADTRMPQTAQAAIGGRGADPELLAAQEVDLQIASLEAEKTTLEAEVRDLTAQRDVMKKEVDQVMPSRREYEAKTSRLDALHKDLANVTAASQDFDRRFGATQGDMRAGLMEVQPLAWTSAETLPASPSLPLVLAAALGVALAGAWMMAAALHRFDRRLWDSREAAAVMDLPVLGAVSLIRSPGRQRSARLWHLVGRTAIAVILLMVIAGSAGLSVRHLSDPKFPRGGGASLGRAFRVAGGLNSGGGQ